MILDERVRAELASTTRFSDVRLLDEIDSTNRFVLELAAGGATEGLVVSADLQTAGRGRLDRKWETEPRTGLLVTVLLRPRDLPVVRWHLLTAACGLAAQDACRDVAGVETELKWPNDLMIGQAKLAGILAESSGGSGTPGSGGSSKDSAVAVGMGLNVHSGPPGAAWLDDAAGHRVSRADLLVSWLRHYDGLLGQWDHVAQIYRARCATVGRAVVVDRVDATRLEGTATGIDADGRLVVETPDGEVTIAVGDVTHLRPRAC